MVRIVGHRGARNLWPENSLTGFRNLLELGADAVEFDIHQTSDGGLVVIHDPLLDRTTHATGPVGARTTAELTAIPLRDSGDRIPRLNDVLELYRESAIEFHIEIKTDAVGNAYEGLEARALAAIERLGLGRRAMLTCFAPQVLETVRRLSPDTRVLASLDRRSCEMLGGLDRAVARVAGIPGCIVAIEKSLLALTLPTWLEAFGSDRVGAWVPNDEADIAYWLAQPIRQITTDRPDLAAALRTKSAGASR